MMNTLKQTRIKILAEQKWWQVPFFDFVDDFRREKSVEMISEPFETCDEKFDALLASTAEILCDELNITPPDWLSEIKPCGKPFFVGEIENLKAISIVQSPLRFRIRKIFVLENFLHRV